MKKIILGVLLLSLISIKAYAADEWAKIQPADNISPSDIGTLLRVNNEAIDRLVSNYKRGCKMAYASSSTITVQIGEVVCSNSAGSLRKFRANTSNTTVTWADIDTGAEASNTTYYVYAVADADATTFTCKISASSSSPNGVTYYKRLGSFLNNSSGDIITSEINNDSVFIDLKNVLGLLTTYDSGWFATSSGSEYTKTHSLGTLKVLWTLYFSPNNDNTNIYLVSSSYDNGYNFDSGTTLGTITTTSATLRGGVGGRYIMTVHTGAGTTTSYSSGYFKLVGIALE